MRKCKNCGGEFKPEVHNQAYCTTRCKRNEENRKRRLSKPVQIYDEEVWELEEKRKESLLARRVAKNEWILGNKTFAMFDIETTQLDADFGRLIGACVKPLGRPATIFSTRKGDKSIAAKVRDEILKYDYIVTWYGTGFDVPYLAARLEANDERPIGKLRHVDMYYTSRSHLKLASHRLSEVTKSLFGEAERTPVVGAIWLRAGEGDPKAIQYIIDHCIADVQDLEDVFTALVPYRNLSATPLRVY